jgi:hypothetical protein
MISVTGFRTATWLPSCFRPVGRKTRTVRTAERKRGRNQYFIYDGLQDGPDKKGGAFSTPFASVLVFFSLGGSQDEKKGWPSTPKPAGMPLADKRLARPTLHLNRAGPRPVGLPRAAAIAEIPKPVAHRDQGVAVPAACRAPCPFIPIFHAYAPVLRWRQRIGRLAVVHLPYLTPAENPRRAILNAGQHRR